MSKKAEKILNSTIKLFLQSGIRKVNMDDIAKYSNVSKVTIYKYFTDKDALYLEISKNIFHSYISYLNNIITSDDTITKKFFTCIDVISDFSNSGKLSLCLDLSKLNIDIMQEYNLYLYAYKSILLNLIEEGKKDNLIKNNYDSNILFHYIDMGVAYYQHNLEYRNKMLNDVYFQKNFMLLYMSSIFIEGTNILEI